MLYNRSSKYLFNLIYNSYISFLFLEDCEIEFKNLYLGNDFNVNYDTNEDLILALFKSADFTSSAFETFFKNISKTEFYEDYYIVDDFHFIVVFKVGNQEKEIIKLFKEGKYSKFPNWYKNQFISNSNIKCVYNIITKNPYLKKTIEQELDVVLSDDAELDSIPDKKQEEFNLAQLIELCYEE